MTSFYKKSKKIIFALLIGILLVYNACSWANVVKAAEDGSFTASDFNIFYSDACSDGQSSITGTDGKTYQCLVLGSADTGNTDYKYASTSTLVTDATAKKWLVQGTENTGRILYYLSGQEVGSTNTGYDYSENTTEFYQSYSIYKYIASWVKTGQIYSTKSGTYYSSGSNSTTGGSDVDSLYKYEVSDSSDYKIFYGLKNLTSDYIFTDESDYGFKKTSDVTNTDNFRYEAITDANGTTITSRDFTEWVLSKTYTTKDVNGQEVSSSHNTSSYYDKTANAFWIYDVNSNKFYAYEVPNNSSPSKWVDVNQSNIDGQNGVYATISPESAEQIVYYWKQWFNYYVTTEQVLTSTTSKSNATIASSTPATTYNNDSYTYYTQGSKYSTTTDYNFNYTLKLPVYNNANAYAFTSDWYENVAQAINATGDTNKYTSTENDKADSKTQHQYNTVDTYDETYTEKGSSITSDNAIKSNTSSILYKLTDTKYSYNYYTTEATYGVDTNSYVNVTAKKASDLGLGLCSNVTGSSYLSNYCLVSNSGTATNKSDFKTYKVNINNNKRYLSTTDWTTSTYNDTTNREYVVSSTKTNVSARVNSQYYHWAADGTTYFTSYKYNQIANSTYYEYTGSNQVKNGTKYTQYYYEITPSFSTEKEWNTNANLSTGNDGSMLAKNPTGDYYSAKLTGIKSQSAYLLTYKATYTNKIDHYYWKTDFNSNCSKWMTSYGFNSNCTDNSEGLTKEGNKITTMISQATNGAINDLENSGSDSGSFTVTGKNNIVYHSDSYNKSHRKSTVGNHYSVDYTDCTITVTAQYGTIYWKGANRYAKYELNGTQYYPETSINNSTTSGNYYRGIGDIMYEYTVNYTYFSSKTKTFTTTNKNELNTINLGNSEWDIPRSYWTATSKFNLYYQTNQEDTYETHYNYNKYRWSYYSVDYSITMSKVDNNSPAVTRCSNINYYNNKDTNNVSNSSGITYNNMLSASTSTTYTNVYSNYQAYNAPSSYDANETKLYLNRLSSRVTTNYKKYDVYEKYTTTTLTPLSTAYELDNSYDKRTINGVYYEKISGTDYYQFTKAHLKVTGETKVGNPTVKFFNQNEINAGAVNNKTATSSANGYRYEKTNITRYYYDTWNVKHRDVIETYSGDNTWYDNDPTASKKTSKTACSTIGIGTVCYTYKSSQVSARSTRTLNKYKIYYKPNQIVTGVSSTTANVAYQQTVYGNTTPANKDSIYTSHLPTYTRACTNNNDYYCYVYNTGSSSQSSTYKYNYTANTVSYSNQMINKALKSNDKYYSQYKNTAGSNSEVETHTYDDVEVVNKLSLYRFMTQSSKSGLSGYYFDNNNKIALIGNTNGTLTYRLTNLKGNSTYYLVASTGSNVTITANNISQQINNTTGKFAFTTDVSGGVNITIRLNASGTATINWIEVLTNNPSSNQYYAYSESTKITTASDSGFNNKKSYQQYYLKSTKTYYPTSTVRSARLNSYKTTNGITITRDSVSDDSTFLQAIIHIYNEGRLASITYAFDIENNGTYVEMPSNAVSFYNADKTKKFVLNKDVRTTLYEQKIKTVNSGWNNTTDTYLKASQYWLFKDIDITKLSNAGSGTEFSEIVNGTVYTAPQDSELGKYLMLYRLIYVQRQFSDTTIVFNHDNRTFYGFSGNNTVYHLFNVFRDENKNNANEKLDKGFTTLSTISEISTFLYNNNLQGLIYDKTSNSFDGIYAYNNNYYKLSQNLDELTKDGISANATTIPAAVNTIPENLATLVLVKDAKDYNNSQIKSGNDTFKLVANKNSENKNIMYTKRLEYKSIGLYEKASDELELMHSYNNANGSSAGDNYIINSETNLYLMKYTKDNVEYKVAIYASSSANAKKFVDASYGVDNSQEVSVIGLTSITDDLIAEALKSGSIFYNNTYWKSPYYYELGTNSNNLYKIQKKDEDVSINTYFTLDSLKDYYLNDHYIGNDLTNEDTNSQLKESLQYSSTLINGVSSFGIHFQGPFNYEYGGGLSRSKTGYISAKLFSDVDEQVPEMILVNTGYKKNTIQFESKTYLTSGGSYDYFMTADNLASYDVYALYAVKTKETTFNYIDFLNKTLLISSTISNALGNNYLPDINKCYSESDNQYGVAPMNLNKNQDYNYYYQLLNVCRKQYSLGSTRPKKYDALFSLDDSEVSLYAYALSNNNIRNLLVLTNYYAFTTHAGNSLARYTFDNTNSTGSITTLGADWYTKNTLNAVFNYEAQYHGMHSYYSNNLFGSVLDAYDSYEDGLKNDTGRTFDTVTSTSIQQNYSVSNTLYYENNVTSQEALSALKDIESTMAEEIEKSWNNAVNTDGSYDYIKVYSTKSNNVYLYKKLSNTNFIKNQGNASYTHILQTGNNDYTNILNRNTRDYTYSLTSEGALANYAYWALSEDEKTKFAMPYTITTTASINDFVPINYYLKKNSNVMKSYELEFDEYNLYGASANQLSLLSNELTGQMGFNHSFFISTKNLDGGKWKVGNFSSKTLENTYYITSNYGQATDYFIWNTVRNLSFQNTNLAFYTFYGLSIDVDNSYLKFDNVDFYHSSASLSDEENQQKYTLRHCSDCNIKISSQLSNNLTLQEKSKNSIQPELNKLSSGERAKKIGLIAYNNDDIYSDRINESIFGYAFVSGNNYLSSEELVDKAINGTTLGDTQKVYLKNSFYADCYRIGNFNMDLTSLINYHSQNTLAKWTFASTDKNQSANYPLLTDCKGNYSINLGTITFGIQEIASTDSSFTIDNSLNHITDTNMAIGENSFKYGFNFNNTSSPTVYNEFSMYYVSTNGHCADGYIYSADKDSSTGKCYLTLNNRTLPTSQNTVKGYKYTFDVMGLVYSSGNGSFGITDENGQVASIPKIGEMSYSSIVKMSNSELLNIAKKKYLGAKSISNVQVYVTKEMNVIYWNTLLTSQNFKVGSDLNTLLIGNDTTLSTSLLPTTRYYVSARIRNQFGATYTKDDWNYEFVTGEDMTSNPYDPSDVEDIINNIKSSYNTYLANSNNETSSQVKATTEMLLNEAIPVDLYNFIITVPSEKNNNYKDILMDADDSQYDFLAKYGYSSNSSSTSVTFDTEAGMKTVVYNLYNQFRAHITNSQIVAVNLYIKTVKLNSDNTYTMGSDVIVKDEMIIKDTTTSKVLVKGKTQKNGSIRINLTNDKLKALVNSYGTDYDAFVYNYLLNYKTNNITFASNNTKFDHNKYYLLDYSIVYGEIKYYVDTNLDSKAKDETYLGSFGEELPSTEIRGDKYEDNYIRKLVYINGSYYLGYVRDGSAIIIK